MMTKPTRKIAAKQPEALFGRVVSILDQARGSVVRAVNTNMVLAYWLIGREIVQELQGGKGRAEYGKRMMSDLSMLLTQRYGRGFSVPNLQNFRTFYLAYSARVLTSANIQYPTGTKSPERQIPHPVGGEFGLASISSPLGTEFAETPIVRPLGVESSQSAIASPMGRESGEAQDARPLGFSPQLTWSHNRALMEGELSAASVTEEFSVTAVPGKLLRSDVDTFAALEKRGEDKRDE